MAQVQAGRWTAEVDDEGVVVFLIGMRINRLARPWKWLPAVMAMPRMLAELDRQPDLGLLSHQYFASGRSLMVVQYWRTWDQLRAYAQASDRAHLPAWRAFNRRTKGNHDVGVFHETYLTQPGQYEAIYVNMPTVGLARATSLAPVSGRGQTAAHRLDPAQPDQAVVPVPKP